MPALGSQFESSTYLDMPAVQTGLPPCPPGKSTLYGQTLFRKFHDGSLRFVYEHYLLTQNVFLGYFRFTCDVNPFLKKEVAA